jgi:hypothetical protein
MVAAVTDTPAVAEAATAVVVVATAVEAAADLVVAMAVTACLRSARA